MRFLLLLLLCPFYAFSRQLPSKPLIDTSVYNKWPTLGIPKISNDGKIVVYTVSAESNTLVLTGTQQPWKMEFQHGPDIFNVTITADNKQVIFITGNDSLHIITAGTSDIRYIPHVQSFKCNGPWLAYQQTKGLTILNRLTGQKKLYKSVTNYPLVDYRFTDDGQVLLLQNDTALIWIDLLNNKEQIIKAGHHSRNIIFDQQHTQLAFITGDSIWHYITGNSDAVLLTNNTDTTKQIDGIERFSNDGNTLFFYTKHIVTVKPEDIVHIWSYKDEKLLSQRLKETDQSRTYLTAINIKDRKIIQLEQEHDQLVSSSFDKNILVSHTKGEAGNGEENWNPAARRSYYLLSVDNNIRKEIKDLSDQLPGTINISPKEKYIVYYSPGKKSFLSYEIATALTRNITQGINTCWEQQYRNDLPNSNKIPRGIAGWTEEDNSLFIYDQYDIWQIDPLGKKKPVNLTNAYGKRHRIIFSRDNDTMIFTAFNTENKKNGFYRRTSGDPELLTMDDFLYDIVDNPYIPDRSGFKVMKATNEKMYVVRRMSATTFPNYYCTSDFKSFTPLSHLYPERSYNWYTTSLHTFKMPDGSNRQGILYKPENFDPGKKYPLIFYYYERKSDGLNAYLQPENLSGSCNINIPTFVSNGYLVFSPDIYYTVGDPMQDTYKTMMAATDYISCFPYVNAAKLGIQGCSFGGIQTNYLITHSQLFAAAYSASGVADFISHYGTVAGGGESVQGVYESGQMRMGASIWQIPDQYIKNSPIFTVDKVTTPLLMMHTTNDGICPFANAVEFFTALRRLGKKAWMLQYDECNHGLWGKPADDLSMRLMQFFNFYLKDSTAPDWME